MVGAGGGMKEKHQLEKEEGQPICFLVGCLVLCLNSPKVPIILGDGGKGAFSSLTDRKSKTSQGAAAQKPFLSN